MTQKAKKSKTQKTQLSLFLQNCKKMEIFASCVIIAFEPIKIQTCSVPQNDHLNLSFVKDIKVVGKTWLEMVIKWTFVSDNNFEIASM